MQEKRENVLREQEKCLVQMKKDEKIRDKKLELRQKLEDKVQYQQNLIETINKIVQKLNFEKSEAEHWAIQQKIEINAAEKLTENLESQINSFKG